MPNLTVLEISLSGLHPQDQLAVPTLPRDQQPRLNTAPESIAVDLQVMLALQVGRIVL